jgi:Omp85 superfamily domain
MGANFLILSLSTAILQSPPPDTASPFSSPAVRRLIERARVARWAGDSAVSDYRSRIRYRLSVGIGRRRWARVPPSAVEEQVADIQWQRPNDLRVDVIGRRYQSVRGDIRLSSVWDRPWFVPRGVDDSVRIFSDDFPAAGALHPLASTAPEWYRYAITGDLSVTPARGGALRLLRVEVTPRRTGPALITGQMWIDSASAQVVRLTFRYVGTGLFVRPGGEERGIDSSRARRLNALANQVVSIDADLEYGLQDGRYWVPNRQVLSGRVRIPIVSDVVIPFQATTTFEDYEINTGRPIAFELPLPDSVGADSMRALDRARRDSLKTARRGEGDEADSLRRWDYVGRWAGGRFELHRPSDTMLGRYDQWPDTLSLATDPEEARRVRQAEVELAKLTEELPDSLTGRSARGFAYERLSDALRYDRVQGLSLGIGYRVRVTAVDFTALYGTVRYGLSDDRVTGRLSILRDAPGGRLVASGYREISALDPFAPAHGIGNTLDALFAGHDNGDYSLVEGGSLGFETSLATGLDLGIGVVLQHEGSVDREATSAVNDFLGGSGVFPPNPPIADGTYGGAWVRLDGLGRRRWSVTADLLAGEGQSTGRLYGQIREEFGGRTGATLELKAGAATQPTLPQSLFRLGGVSTVRGFEYGELRGQAFWAARLDVAPLRGRLRPVLFADAGQAASLEDLFSSEALAGVGVGLSVFDGLLRFDFSYPITPDVGGKVRFDIVVKAAR